MTSTYTINNAYHGIEITFDGRPSAEIRAQLRAAGYRWHHIRKLWYARNTAENLNLARVLCGDTESAEELNAAPVEPTMNAYGVQVGDVFRCSWGYDQTNEDFFQVVALVGSGSVRVRQVSLPILKEDGVGPMASNYTYALTHEILPATGSIWIKDQEKGDLKRLQEYNGSVFFKIGGGHSARLVTGDKITVYESWYA